MDCMHNFCDWMNDVLIYVCSKINLIQLLRKWRKCIIWANENDGSNVEGAYKHRNGSFSQAEKSSSQSFFIYWGLVGKEMTS